MTKNTILGFLLVTTLAACSTLLSRLIPHQLIGAGVCALLLGMFLSSRNIDLTPYQPAFTFSSKKLLRLAIILMGTTLSAVQVIEVGRYSLIVMSFTLFAAFFGGHVLGRVLGMDWRLSSLISTGTGICGGSAIAAVSPVIEADDSDIAYAISATFLFDVLMVVLFPLMGRWFGMSDVGFGLWAGTAVNDTSSVVAAGYAFSDLAGRYATVVKLTRTLTIVPVVVLFSFISARAKGRAGKGATRQKVSMYGIFPYFILLFLLMVLVRALGWITPEIAEYLGRASKFAMVMALGAIGLKTDLSKLKASGWTPLLHGFLVSTLVVVVSFAAQSFLGQL
jgi:uncharacterized integral membrane protein (TIGR00698 family)